MAVSPLALEYLAVESGLLTAAGGAVGLVFAWWGTNALRPLIPANVPRAEGIGLDLQVLAFTAAVTVAAGSLSIWALLALLVLVGACEVVFDSSAQAFLPTLVSGSDLPRANGYLFAAEVVTGEGGDALKARLRTGTVVTTDDRNWELRYTLSALRFNQSRAVAIDMESATVAAQGYRFRVPYGTLLCVSDKPLHGEIKLPGQANAFYDRAISQHLRIGIEALLLLKREGDALHSRKLRSFDEPPLRRRLQDTEAARRPAALDAVRPGRRHRRPGPRTPR